MAGLCSLVIVMSCKHRWLLSERAETPQWTRPTLDGTRSATATRARFANIASAKQRRRNGIGSRRFFLESSCLVARLQPGTRDPLVLRRAGQLASSRRSAGGPPETTSRLTARTHVRTFSAYPALYLKTPLANSPLQSRSNSS